MFFPPDYYERVYAGVLGKIIGVYLGRPFEGWTYEQIMAELGEIEYYINDRKDLPLRNHQIVVTDDDISGTFTFLRAMPDYGNHLDLTAKQIGQTWLNYIIEDRTILWWGGFGNSTEHTAYLRLKKGIPAPRSGSITLNGRVVSEQIGAQIFIEGWGLISPGDPALAADLARRAASVSHDGEAIYGAQVIAAMVAQAFIEPNLDVILETALSLIPKDSLIYQLGADVREWYAIDSEDWQSARRKLADVYGYDTYSGNCHIIPNHGLVILSLLYGRGDFSTSQRIVNTCGWDTDCNAANLGCILGVRNGLATFEGGLDWRGPVADRLYIPTADGGRAISDSVIETDHIMEIAHAIRGKRWNHPKGGARFHFSLPGSVQGFKTFGNLTLKNVQNPRIKNNRALALCFNLQAGETALAMTDTFVPPEAIDMPGYELLASPTIYPGQNVIAMVLGEDGNTTAVNIAIALERYGEEDGLEVIYGPVQSLTPGQEKQFDWVIPGLDGMPITRIGVALTARKAMKGIVYLDSLGWKGSPRVSFHRPTVPGRMWKRQWIDALDHFEDRFGEAFRLIQDRGQGLAITGTRQWCNYSLESTLTPHLVRAFGLAARVQGLERYYALLLVDRDTARLVKRLDGEIVLKNVPYKWNYGQAYTLRILVDGSHVCGWVDGNKLFHFEDLNHPLSTGAIGLVCEEGRVGTDLVSVDPVNNH